MYTVKRLPKYVKKNLQIFSDRKTPKRDPIETKSVQKVLIKGPFLCLLVPKIFFFKKPKNSISQKQA